jgi:hypothetical protein
MIRLGSLVVCATLGAGILSCGSNTAIDTTSSGGSGGGAGGASAGGASAGGSSGGGAGGSSSTAFDPLSLVPRNNDVSGWTVDSSVTKSGSAPAKTASNEKEAVDMIDGGAAPFYRAPYSPKFFMWQNYANETLPAAPPPTTGSLMLYILQMPSEDQAKGLYADLVKVDGTDYTRLAGTDKDWKAPAQPLGTESRIQDTGAQWWINFYKGVYYVEVMLFPSYGPKPDYTPSDPTLRDEALRFAKAVASKM